MILKGNQRGNGRDLATHLLNEADNGRIEVAEIRGAMATDLHGAFADFEAFAVGTRCEKPLYSLSINPSAPISRAQYMAAIARIEGRLGFTGQPRTIVFHVKARTGREHCHVVWSRIDGAKMRAIHLAHDHMKLRTLARELAFEFGLELPPGLAQDRGSDRFFDPPEITMAEKAQAEETAIAPEDRRAEVTAAWRSADSPAAFAQALEARGYFLATGGRRAFVVVDRHGHVHSLSRQIEGVNTKALKAFFADFALPSLDEAKTCAASWFQAQDDRQREKAASLRPAAAAILRRKQATRRLAMLRRIRSQRGRHEEEAATLFAAQQRERDKPAHRVFSAVLALFARLPVFRSVLWHIRRKPFLSFAERHRLEREALERRHAREKQDIERLRRALRLIERREQQALARSRLRAVRATDHKLDMFAVNAFDITAPALGQGAEEQRLNHDRAEEAPDLLGPHIITAPRPAAPAGAGSQSREPAVPDDGCDPIEAELDRLYALLRTGLAQPFNDASRIREARERRRHGIIEPPPIPAVDPPRPVPVDPIEAELDRLYALLRTGLSPPFNDAAGIKERRRPGDHRAFHIAVFPGAEPPQPAQSTPIDPIEAELDRLYALLRTGLSPWFNYSAGVPQRRKSDDESAFDITDPGPRL